MSVKSDVIESFQESFRRGLVCGAVGIARIQALERFARGRQIAPHDELGQGQRTQRDPQQQQQAADTVVVFQKQGRDRQHAAFQSVETMFRLPFLPITINGAGYLSRDKHF